MYKDLNEDENRFKEDKVPFEKHDFFARHLKNQKTIF